jgi:hypothetical protein
VAEVQADLVLTVDQALSEIQALGDLITEVTTGVTVDAQVQVDTAQAEAEVSAIEAPPVEVPIEVDTGQAEAEIEAIEVPPVEVPVEVTGGEDIAEVDDALAGATGSASAFGGVRRRRPSPRHVDPAVLRHLRRSDHLRRRPRRPARRGPQRGW